MKLLIVFAQREDGKTLTERFREANLAVTVVPSEGGFLRRQNATLFAALPDERVEEALTLIREACPSRTEHVDTVFGAGGVESIGLPDTTEVPVGGATILVLPIEHSEKT